MQLATGVFYSKAINKAARSVDAVLSSETVDSHGDIVDQASIKLDRYSKNPVVLYQHSYNQVIGHAEDVAVRGGQLEARIVFATTPLASEVFQLFLDRAMRAFSIGFRVGKVASEQVGGRTIRRLLECELIECSAVSVPSNPDAVVRYKSLGLVPAQYDASADVARVASERAFGTLTHVGNNHEGDPSAEIASLAHRRVAGEDTDSLSHLFPELFRLALE